MSTASSNAEADQAVGLLVAAKTPIALMPVPVATQSGLPRQTSHVRSKMIPLTKKDWVLYAGIVSNSIVWYAVGDALRILYA